MRGVGLHCLKPTWPLRRYLAGRLVRYLAGVLGPETIYADAAAVSVATVIREYERKTARALVAGFVEHEHEYEYERMTA